MKFNAMKVLLLFVCIAFGQMAIGQQGDIKIVKDNRIDALVEKQGAIIPPAIKPEIDGFRIQLFFDSNKDAIYSARSKFISQFPKVDTYVEFNAPNFMLKVGDFRTRLEAEKVKSEVEAEFPTSFVIKEKINLPRIDKDID